MFGIFLPLNFNSPYKATSIIDFWRRWHMTLSQFLRDYLYIPLGGNRRGRVLRYVNLMITMLLGGLWHGAAWTFVAWGALHGVYLCINHAWNNYGPAVAPRFAPLANIAGLILTFLAVVIAWVFFRADNIDSALLRAVEDGRSHATSPLAAARSPIPPSSSSTPCSPGSRRTRRRSWVTITRDASSAKSSPRGGCVRCFCTQPRPCWPSGYSEFSSTANSSISGSDETGLADIWCSFLVRRVAVMLMAVALNFVVDPLQLFRPARFYHPMYSNDSRMQNAGLIRSQDFDTVFMGTSLAIHFRQSDIDRLVGGHSLKLAMSGSTSHEQSFVLAAALERHPKRVIWQIDDWIFRDAPDVDSNPFLPANLYRRNARGLGEYLFSGAMARESLWMLARSVKPFEKTVARLTTGVLFKFPIADADDINILAPSFDVAGFYNARKSMAAFVRIIDPVRSAYLAEGYDYEAMVRIFESDAIGLIEKNPDVKFDIYFPPYSILQFVAMRDASPATLKIVYDFTAYAFPRLTKFPNVSLHDFREAKEITHDLGNYGDVIHHSPAIDLKVLSLIAERKYVVDPKAPLASLERLKAQIEVYRMSQ